jgi:HEAT repeat protein
MSTNLSSLIAALSSSDAASRADAAERLAQLGPKAKPAALALVLACGDDDETVRQWATDALEGMGPPEAADVAQLASLVEAKSPDVGYWAATLLGRLKTEAASAVESLAQVVAGGGDLAVRQRAAWALGEIGPPAAKAVPALQKAGAAPDPRLSRLAQAAISQIVGQ